jgi:hypothetical protein
MAMPFCVLKPLMGLAFNPQKFRYTFVDCYNILGFYVVYDNVKTI